VESVYALFRVAGLSPPALVVLLSGGEQQMVAIAGC